jgi:hypothetical protein
MQTTWLQEVRRGLSALNQGAPMESFRHLWRGLTARLARNSTQNLAEQQDQEHDEHFGEQECEEEEDPFDHGASIDNQQSTTATDDKRDPLDLQGLGNNTNSRCNKPRGFAQADERKKIDEQRRVQVRRPESDQADDVDSQFHDSESHDSQEDNNLGDDLMTECNMHMSRQSRSEFTLEGFVREGEERGNVETDSPMHLQGAERRWIHDPTQKQQQQQQQGTPHPTNHDKRSGIDREKDNKIYKQNRPMIRVMGYNPLNASKEERRTDIAEEASNFDVIMLAGTGRRANGSETKPQKPRS